LALKPGAAHLSESYMMNAVNTRDVLKSQLTCMYKGRLKLVEEAERSRAGLAKPPRRCVAEGQAGMIGERNE
jgi:hypothetical protein